MMTKRWHSYRRLSDVIAEENKALRRQVDELRQALEALTATDRKFVTVEWVTANEYVAHCNFCGENSCDERLIEHKPKCPIVQARAALAALKEKLS